MADSHVVSALKEKRARLAGELEALKLRVTAVTVELGSVDNCLRIFRSDVDPATIAPKVSFAKSALPKGAGTRPFAPLVKIAMAARMSRTESLRFEKIVPLVTENSALQPLHFQTLRVWNQ